MMTETISLAETQAADSPRIPRPHTDGAALRAIEDATAHVRERALKIRQNPEEHMAKLDNFASKDMPGRQRHIQDCVDQILAKVDPKPAAS
jgi:hypothetical protein